MRFTSCLKILVACASVLTASGPSLAAEAADGEAVDLVAGSAAESRQQTEKASGELDAHPLYHLRPAPYSDAGMLTVSLGELLELAVANNLGVARQHYTIEKTHYTVDQTYYAFDPAVRGTLSYDLRNLGTASATAGGGLSGSDSYSMGLHYSVPREYGDAFQIGYDLGRSSYKVYGGSDGEIEIPTTYSAGFSMGYTRPLGRGAGRYYNRIARFAASNNLLLTYDKLDDDVRRLKKSVLDTYYQAVAARRAITVRETSLDVALKQLERTVERYKVGLAIRTEMLQAENSVLTQRSALLEAHKSFDDLRDVLTTLVGLPRELALAVDDEGALLVLGSDLPADLWDLVIANSYDLKGLNTQLANLRLQRDQQLADLRPDVSLALSYGRSGEDDALGRALGGYEKENYGASVTWNATPGQRSARAGLAQTELDLASLELSIQEVELALKTSLREQQRDLETKRKQIELAESNLGVVREAHTIMLARHDVGLATTLDVVEAQEAVLNAELALLGAQVAYQQAYREILLMAGLI